MASFYASRGGEVGLGLLTNIILTIPSVCHDSCIAPRESISFEPTDTLTPLLLLLQTGHIKQHRRFKFPLLIHEFEDITSDCRRPRMTRLYLPLPSPSIPPVRNHRGGGGGACARERVTWGEWPLLFYCLKRRLNGDPPPLW